MGEHTSISWTNSTWTPIRARSKETGKQGHYCQKISPGCANCYSASMNGWRGNGVPYAVDKFDQVEMYLDEKALLDPMKWKKSRMIFVCSMTDLFADFVSDEWIDKMFAVMALCPQHTFQVLTKRPERMQAYFDKGRFDRVRIAASFISKKMQNEWSWPLSNCWLGTSVENQKYADERIPYLLGTPATVRFLSCEPLLGPIDLEYPKSMYPDGPPMCCSGTAQMECGCQGKPTEPPLIYGINWIITGGESGIKARPMLSQWADDIKTQCESWNVAYFHKQNGMYIDAGHEEFGRLPAGPLKYLRSDGTEWPAGKVPFDENADVNTVKRVGRKRAGDTLYGKMYHEFPEVKA